MSDRNTEPTVAERLLDSLRSASRFNPNDAERPAVLLWTDQGSQWAPVVVQLRRLLPELLTYGEYRPERRTGPAIWVRTAIDRVLEEVKLAEDLTPIIYLPGVGRQALRAVDECPDSLKPLVELQYRGTCWTQKNGRDWTVEAFLVSPDGGLGLDVARDDSTRTAMLGALGEVADTPVHRLRGKRLEREDFDRLLLEDLPRDLLRWMNDPSGTKVRWTPGRCTAFRSRCREELEFDPDKDGELVAAERLGRRLGPWESIWSRFAESPASYPQVVDLLRTAKPADILEDQSSSWPQNNDEQEDALRESLAGLGAKPAAEAATAIQELEDVHGPRRTWVWAKAGKAPLVHALDHLSRLVRAASTNLGGASLADLGDQYATSAYEVDDAALAAIAAVRRTADFEAVSAALDAVYRPWLEQAARQLQALAEQNPLPCATETDPAELVMDAGGVMLFADGLRFDVSKRLVAEMRNKGLDPSLSWRWAGLPSVTATGKPAVSPVASALAGRSPGEGFSPVTAEGGQALTTDRFRKLLASVDCEFLSPGEIGDPNGRGWTEDGSLDKRGHDLEGRLAAQVDHEVELLLERVESLLAAGWSEVRIVTDHGWLWLPGGLPKVDLPHYLAESRWARCAAIKGNASVEVPTSPWYWNREEQVALAPGIACFKAGHQYAHGGLSPQESIVPVITVAANPATGPAVAIENISWVGLRCRVRVHVPGDVAPIRVQLRTKVNDAGSALSQAREVDSNGDASLLVEDEDLEGTSAVIVALDMEGRPVAQTATIVGGQ